MPLKNSHMTMSKDVVSQSTFCATLLLVHVCASWVTEARHQRKLVVPEGEVSSVPRKEGRRTYLYILFAISVTLWILCVRIALEEMRLGIWQSASPASPALVRCGPRRSGGGHCACC